MGGYHAQGSKLVGGRLGARTAGNLLPEINTLNTPRSPSGQTLLSLHFRKVWGDVMPNPLGSPASPCGCVGYGCTAGKGYGA